jgi:hypothetical protein
MIPCDDRYKAFLASNSPGRVSCALFKRRDNLVIGLSEYSRPFVFDLEGWMNDFGLSIVPSVLGTGKVLFGPVSAYFKTDVDSNSGLSVGSVELTGPSAPPSITEDDLRAGLWDFCGVTLFEVNVSDLTMGALIKRCGNIGQVSMNHPEVKIEILGASKAYQRTIGRIIKPACDWTLGDSRCTVDLTPYTVTGTLTGFAGDGLILMDSSRTEAGPASSIDIVSLTNADPCVITTDSPLGLPDGAAVTLAGIVGPDSLNGISVLHNPGDLTFELDIDTSDTSFFPPYTGAGTVTALGGASGYFDYGKMWFTTGPNANPSIIRDIRTYVPGQWTLWQPFPYPLGPDDYVMVVGCGKMFVADCVGKFNNGINHGGFPYCPGLDAVTRPSS